MEEFKLEPADEKIRKYKSNWQRHVTRMNNMDTATVDIQNIPVATLLDRVSWGGGRSTLDMAALLFVYPSRSKS